MFLKIDKSRYSLKHLTCNLLQSFKTALREKKTPLYDDILERIFADIDPSTWTQVGFCDAFANNLRCVSVNFTQPAPPSVLVAPLCVHTTAVIIFAVTAGFVTKVCTIVYCHRGFLFRSLLLSIVLFFGPGNCASTA